MSRVANWLSKVGSCSSRHSTSGSSTPAERARPPVIAIARARESPALATRRSRLLSAFRNGEQTACQTGLVDPVALGELDPREVGVVDVAAERHDRGRRLAALARAGRADQLDDLLERVREGGPVLEVERAPDPLAEAP